MSRWKALPGRPRVAAGLFLTAVAWGAGPAAAQELQLKRDYPGSAPYRCTQAPAFAQPGAEARAQASQLGSNAAQARVLGDLPRAEALLARATEIDPASAELAYRHARVLEDLGQREAALTELCRFLSFGVEPEGTSDAQARLEALADVDPRVIPDQAIQAFIRGLSLADEGAPEGAASFFGTAIQWAPEWSEAHFNHAVVLLRLGRRAEAAADLRRYLELEPGADDALAVSQRLGQLEIVPSTVSPGAAFTLGVLLPGMGQFYSGRSLGGLTVMTLAGGAAAAGLMIKEINVRCLVSVGGGEECPSGQVWREDVERPYLIPALGAAAAVTIIGAIEAFVKARGRRGAEPARAEAREAPAGPRLEVPAVTPRGTGVDVNLLRVTFR